MGDYQKINKLIGSVRKNCCASWHCLCKLWTFISCDDYALVSAHSTGQWPEKLNCDKLKRTDCESNSSYLFDFCSVQFHGHEQ